MSNIAKHLQNINSRGEKALSVFLTSGFPEKDTFAELACRVFDAGADLLEIGFPFSDPLADGPVIQNSSHAAIMNGVNISATFGYVEKIKAKHDKPVIMMGYANPVLKYGLSNFAKDAVNSGVNGVIIPDIPIEEYDDFFADDFSKLEVIMLITPTTSSERIIAIDKKSRGFVYCVSVSGTTGVRSFNNEAGLGFISKAYPLIKNNKMLVGFGISTADDVKRFAPNCDGVIVGSAVIKSLIESKGNYDKACGLVSDLKKGCLPGC